MPEPAAIAHPQNAESCCEYITYLVGIWDPAGKSVLVHAAVHGNIHVNEVTLCVGSCLCYAECDCARLCYAKCRDHILFDQLRKFMHDIPLLNINCTNFLSKSGPEEAIKAMLQAAIASFRLELWSCLGLDFFAVLSFECTADTCDAANEHYYPDCPAIECCEHHVASSKLWQECLCIHH